MRLSVKKGFSFGLASGIITTLGLIVGLESSTQSAMVVIGGILVIAVADSMSDALGIHLSEEAESKNSTKHVWESTLATFISKFVFALTFIVPVILLPLSTATIVCIIWGLSLIIIFSFFIAKSKGANPFKAISEHLFIAVIVIIVTHYLGNLVATFGK